MSDTLIAIRHYSVELTRICEGFLESLPFPVKYLKHVGHDFEDFMLKDVFDLECERLVLLDEDCFVFRPESVVELLSYMQENEYSACGVPDGGVAGSPLRRSPVVPNLFFCLVDLERLRKYHGQPPPVTLCRYNRRRVYELPSFLDGTRYNFKVLGESYYRFFYWVLGNDERILYLRPRLRGGATVVCDHLDRECAIHAWFARDFERLEDRRRILNVAAHARERLNGGS